MDLVDSCKEKLAYFRIKELKDILGQIGFSKQGKKQDLVDRILAILSDEQVSKMSGAKNNAVGKEELEKLIDDTYRKMQVSGAADLASKELGVSDSGTVKVGDGSNSKSKAVTDEQFQLHTKVRCPCGNSLENESMIMCEDRRCQVWQHMGCVVIPEKPMEVDPPIPENFYCEICRLSRADPFLVTLAHPLYPVKLTTTSIPTDGTNPVVSMERTFQLTRADRDLLSKLEYDVQAWCMLLNDKVLYRMQWPQYIDLQVNGMPVRAINRPGSQLLGVNGRDDGPHIKQCTRDGINKICVTGCDARIFCVGVRIVKRRSVQQVLNMVPVESDGEKFDDALARVCRCVGGSAIDNADSDSDLEVVADSFTVNLRCPMSGSRMKVSGRFKPCAHMGCFDLDVFVEMNQRSRKWQCPICLKNYSLDNIIIDPYFNRITSMMRYCDEDVTDIEVKPDGSWRVKAKSKSERRDLGDLVQWHFPDGTLYIPNDIEAKPKLEALKQVKQEGLSEGHTGLKIGIRKNHNGLWEVSRPEDMYLSFGNKFENMDGHHEQKVIPMSSSATASGRDGEDTSVNHDGNGNFDCSANNEIELDSISLNVDSVFPDHNPSVQPGNAEVIVLSDSEEENDILGSSGARYNNNRTDDSEIAFSIPPTGQVDAYTEEPTLGGGGSSCLGLFDPNDDEFGMPIWPMPPGSQAGPGFQLFSSEAEVSDAFADLQHGSINCPTLENGYMLAPDNAFGSSILAPDTSVHHSDTDLNDGLVDNPLAFGGDDPSLQIFLPTRPSGAAEPSDLRDQSDISTGIRTEDWISLRLGDGASGSHGEPAGANGSNSRLQTPSREGDIDTLADSASLILGMNDGRSEKINRERSDSPFTFPRQKRSVRPRLYLSIDSDSE